MDNIRPDLTQTVRHVQRAVDELKALERVDASAFLGEFGSAQEVAAQVAEMQREAAEVLNLSAGSMFQNLNSQTAAAMAASIKSVQAEIRETLNFDVSGLLDEFDSERGLAALEDSDGNELRSVAPESLQGDLDGAIGAIVLTLATVAFVLVAHAALIWAAVHGVPDAMETGALLLEAVSLGSRYPPVDGLLDLLMVAAALKTLKS